MIGLWCVVSWKLGWTYAGPNEPLLRVVSNSYQQHAARGDEVRVNLRHTLIYTSVPAD